MSRPLREIAEENGWSLKDIADRSDSATSTVGNFLKGKTQAGPELLKKLAKTFKIPPDEIDNPQPDEDARALALHEDTGSTDDWMRRALLAEKRLADLRHGLGKLLTESSTSYRQPIERPLSFAATPEDKAAVAAAEAAAASRSDPKSRH